MDKNYKKIGLFIGKFLPPHIGHIAQIKKCASECDTLYVIVADSKKRTREICKNANIKPIYAKKRLKILKKALKSIKNIKFKFMSQGMLESFPDKLDDWKKLLKKTTKNKFDFWFVDNNYLEISKKYFPEYNFIGFDRSEIDISSTKIRNDFDSNLVNIIPEARKKIKQLN